jgi:hypothetical protein
MGLSLMNMLGLSPSVHFAHIACNRKFFLIRSACKNWTAQQSSNKCNHCRNIILKRNSSRNERYICNPISEYNETNNVFFVTMLYNCSDCVLPSCRSKDRWTLRRNLIYISLTTGLHLVPSVLDTLNFVSISCLLVPTNDSCPLVLPSGAEWCRKTERSTLNSVTTVE